MDPFQERVPAVYNKGQCATETWRALASTGFNGGSDPPRTSGTHLTLSDGLANS